MKIIPLNGHPSSPRKFPSSLKTKRAHVTNSKAPAPPRPTFPTNSKKNNSIQPPVDPA